MNLKNELQPLFNTAAYKGKTIAEIERVAELGKGTLNRALKLNQISVRVLEQLGAPAGYSFGLKLKKVK